MKGRRLTAMIGRWVEDGAVCRKVANEVNDEEVGVRAKVVDTLVVCRDAKQCERLLQNLNWSDRYKEMYFDALLEGYTLPLARQ